MGIIKNSYIFALFLILLGTGAYADFHYGVPLNYFNPGEQTVFVTKTPSVNEIAPTLPFKSNPVNTLIIPETAASVFPISNNSGSGSDSIVSKWQPSSQPPPSQPPPVQQSPSSPQSPSSFGSIIGGIILQPGEKINDGFYSLELTHVYTGDNVYGKLFREGTYVGYIDGPSNTQKTFSDSDATATVMIGSVNYALQKAELRLNIRYLTASSVGSVCGGVVLNANEKIPYGNYVVQLAHVYSGDRVYLKFYRDGNYLGYADLGVNEEKILQDGSYRLKVNSCAISYASQKSEIKLSGSQMAGTTQPDTPGFYGTFAINGYAVNRNALNGAISTGILTGSSSTTGGGTGASGTSGSSSQQPSSAPVYSISITPVYGTLLNRNEETKMRLKIKATQNGQVFPVQDEFKVTVFDCSDETYTYISDGDNLQSGCMLLLRTDENGMRTLKFKSRKAGMYTVRASYNGVSESVMFTVRNAGSSSGNSGSGSAGSSGNRTGNTTDNTRPAPPQPPADTNTTENSVIEIRMSQGWTFFSLPVNRNIALSEIEGTCGSLRQGDFDMWNPERGVYEQPLVLNGGKGYWYYSNQACKIKVGNASSSGTLMLKTGWNAAGVFNRAISVGQVRSACNVTSSFWKYDSALRDYVRETESLKPKNAYFVRVSAPCSVSG